MSGSSFCLTQIMRRISAPTMLQLNSTVLRLATRRSTTWVEDASPTMTTNYPKQSLRIGNPNIPTCSKEDTRGITEYPWGHRAQQVPKHRRCSTTITGSHNQPCFLSRFTTLKWNRALRETMRIHRRIPKVNFSASRAKRILTHARPWRSTWRPRTTIPTGVTRVNFATNRSRVHGTSNVMCWFIKVGNFLSHIRRQNNYT